MDIRMPVMDGYQAARAIRALDFERAASVPIIAMSADAYDSDVARSLDAGMNAHIAKPVDAQVLYRTIYEACSVS
jgi:CheY-like chemotaxis protein